MREFEIIEHEKVITQLNVRYENVILSVVFKHLISLNFTNDVWGKEQ